MRSEFIPLLSALISAVVALLVSWFSSRRTLRLELDKLRLSTQQLALSKLLEVRIREYPALYSMLSDLPKAAESESAAVDLGQLLNRVNEWDSRYAIFMGPETSNTCYAFRQALRTAAGAESPASATAQMLRAAERLELALRSDIGIHGIAVSGPDLSPRQRESY
jgi:hypothetical protein